MASSLLTIRSLDAFYGRAHVLHKVSLPVDRGDIVAVLGRNGVGKTTLLKSIMGIEVTRRGEILFRDEDISRLKPHEIAKRGIFYVPDDAGLFPGMSVMDNLRLAAGKKNFSIEPLEDIYPEIKGLLNRRADLLSGGERKIVSILRSLLTGSEVLLLDEPTEGVMPLMVKRIHSMLDTLKRRGMTIILIESGTKLQHIMGIATKISVMSSGRIVYFGEREKAEGELDIIKKHLFV